MKKRIQMNQKGFTLIEMLIVMVIVGVLVLLVFPKASAVLEKIKSPKTAKKCVRRANDS